MIGHTFSKPIQQAVDELIQFIDNNPLNRTNISTLFPHYYSNRYNINRARQGSVEPQTVIPIVISASKFIRVVPYQFCSVKIYLL